jgi:acetylornithine/N-succinyldiaminopimelate aminotransferase
VEKAYDKGVILVSAGANVLRFVPPLIITKEEWAQAVLAVGDILQTI